MYFTNSRFSFGQSCLSEEIKIKLTSFPPEMLYFPPFLPFFFPPVSPGIRLNMSPALPPNSPETRMLTSVDPARQVRKTPTKLNETGGKVRRIGAEIFQHFQTLK